MSFPQSNALLEPQPLTGLTSFSDPSRKHVILCCDCEGTYEQLSRMYEAIESAGIAANFFFVGDTARAYPELVQQIASRHQSESHTMTHANLRSLDFEGQRREILDGKQAVEEVIGRPTRGFRAPFHKYNADTVRVLNENGFVFDASRLYYFHDMKQVHEVKPTWFREWMPLYGKLGISPRGAFNIFRTLVKLRRVTVLPAHPHYAGMNAELAREFESFLKWAVDQGAVFWPIDKWLLQRDAVPLPGWVSPLGPEVRLA